MNCISKIPNPDLPIHHSNDAEANTKNTAQINTNSLAYLAYQNRKKKGLISGDTLESPIIFFTDEWIF